MPETPDHLTITRRSDVTGAVHTLVLPMTETLPQAPRFSHGVKAALPPTRGNSQWA